MLWRIQWTYPKKHPLSPRRRRDTVATMRRQGLPGDGRRIRPVLAGLGAFLVAFGLLLRLYAGHPV